MPLMRYPGIMRTTLGIDDELLSRAKKRANERGVTLGSVVDDALRQYFVAPARESAVIDLPVAEQSRLRADIDPSSNRALYAALDETGEVRA